MASFTSLSPANITTNLLDEAGAAQRENASNRPSVTTSIVPGNSALDRGGLGVLPAIHHPPQISSFDLTAPVRRSPATRWRSTGFAGPSMCPGRVRHLSSGRGLCMFLCLQTSLDKGVLTESGQIAVCI